MPDPSNPPSAENSFNCDRLAEMHSAESIRQSMQKYLQDKHEHLKKTSQQLVDRSGGGGGEKRDEVEGIHQLSTRLGQAGKTLGAQLGQNHGERQ